MQVELNDSVLQWLTVWVGRVKLDRESGNAGVAQLVEQRFRKSQVARSIRAAGLREKVRYDFS